MAASSTRRPDPSLVRLPPGHRFRSRWQVGASLARNTTTLLSLRTAWDDLLVLCRTAAANAAAAGEVESYFSPPDCSATARRERAARGAREEDSSSNNKKDEGKTKKCDCREVGNRLVYMLYDSFLVRATDIQPDFQDRVGRRGDNLRQPTTATSTTTQCLPRHSLPIRLRLLCGRCPWRAAGTIVRWLLGSAACVTLYARSTADHGRT
jgi:hypothetical protein